MTTENDDTAATLQQEYDLAVYEHGKDSAQAQEAEKAAKQYFQKGKPAPINAGSSKGNLS